MTDRELYIHKEIAYRILQGLDDYNPDKSAYFTIEGYTGLLHFSMDVYPDYRETTDGAGQPHTILYNFFIPDTQLYARSEDGDVEQIELFQLKKQVL